MKNYFKNATDTLRCIYQLFRLYSQMSLEQTRQKYPQAEGETLL